MKEPARKYASVVDDLITNPTPRCPCVLVLDTSASMQDDPIESLNDGISLFLKELRKDPIACLSIELAVVSFGGEAEVVRGFENPKKIRIPRLSAAGVTPMAEALELAFDLIGERLGEYEQKGVGRVRPLILLLTDGQPTDEKGEPSLAYKSVAARLKRADETPHLDPTGIRVRCFAIGDHANLKILSEFCGPDPGPIRISASEIRKLFIWASMYVGQEARGLPGLKLKGDDF